MTQTLSVFTPFTDWSLAAFKSTAFLRITTVKPRIKNLVVVASLIAILLGASAEARVFDDPTAGGTVISNRAEASYRNEAGEAFSTVSPTVTITVLTVATIAVTPDETAPSDTVAPRDRITRLRFTFEMADITHLSSVLAAVKKVDGVFDALRVVPS